MGHKLKCKLCEDIIESKHRHDFKSCKCGSISIDGGSVYTRIVGNPKNCIWIDENGKEKEVLPKSVSEKFNEAWGDLKKALTDAFSEIIDGFLKIIRRIRCFISKKD